MFKNGFFVVGVLPVLLVTVAVSQPFSSSPTAQELSWPPRPDYSHLSEQPLVLMTSQKADDFYQRHPELSAAAGFTFAASDYFLRHPEFHIPSTPTDLSDYFLRH